MDNSNVTLQKESTFTETNLSSQSGTVESKLEGEYGLYMIYSSNPLNEIRKFVDSYDEDGKEAIKLMRIDYIKDTSSPHGGYKETNRTVVIMKHQAARDLHAEGYGTRTGYDFVIVPYAIRKNNHPPKSTSYAYFISLPEELDNDTARDQLHLKFASIVEVGFLAKNEYTIIFPSKSREEGESNDTYRGHAIVTFSNKVDREIIAKIKVILDMTRWYMKNEKGEETTSFVHIAYCRNSALSNLTNTRPKHRVRPIESSLNNEETAVRTAPREAKPKAKTVIAAGNRFELLDEDEESVSVSQPN